MERVGDFRARWRLLALGCLAAAVLPGSGCGIIEGVKGAVWVRDKWIETDIEKKEAEAKLAANKKFEDQRDADRAEANRSRALPPEHVDRLAKRIAEQIAEDLPDNKVVRDYLKSHRHRLVLAQGEVTNTAHHTTAGAVENLLDKVFGHLQRDPRITAAFDVVTDRGSAERLYRQSEGETDEIIEGAGGSGPIRYQADQICAIDLKLYEFDRPGQTTWEVRVEAIYLKSRAILLTHEEKAP